jgi:hypothetical protein
VTLFLGDRSIRIPWAAVLAILALVAAGALAAVANVVVPALFGVAPALPLPGPVQAAANFAGFVAGIAVQLGVILWLFARWEGWLAGRRDRGSLTLVPLSALAAQGLTLAPNLPPEDRHRILQALDDLTARDDLTAILAVVDADDAADASTSRLLVTATAPARRVRALLGALRSDGVAVVGAADRARYIRLGAPPTGTMWHIIWD